MVRRLYLLCWCLSLMGVVFLFVGCETESPEPQTVIRPVRYQRVVATSASRVRMFAGTARAGHETKLSFKVDGTIRKLPIEVGDVLKPGDLVAEIDPKDYTLRTREAEAALARSRAEVRNAGASYSRTRALYENNNASRQELDAARATYESAQASVRSYQTQVEQARRQVSYTRLITQVGGAVAQVPMEVNENVSAGQTIALLTSAGKPKVLVAIPEVFIASIARDNPVEVTFDAVPDEQFSARVTEVGVAATGAATTFPVTVELDETDSRIRSGLASNVRFVFGNGQEAQRLVAPVQAVGEDQEGRFVFLVEPQGETDGIVRRRAVSVGALSSEGLEIQDGLVEGDLLVIAGVKRLQDGQAVKVLASQEAP